MEKEMTRLYTYSHYLPDNKDFKVSFVVESRYYVPDQKEVTRLAKIARDTVAADYIDYVETKNEVPTEKKDVSEGKGWLEKTAGMFDSSKPRTSDITLILLDRDWETSFFSVGTSFFVST